MDTTSRYDIITFGSASEDVFVFSKKFLNKKLCFSLGEKIETDKIMIHTGGGGTNAATTFAKQGFKTAYCGSVGNDYAGFSVLLDLKRFHISSELLSSLKGKNTNHSVVLSKKEEGRVILVRRDASNYVAKDFSFKKLRADWFYVAPLAGQYLELTKQILEHAKLYKIKVALNPSKEQILMIKKNLKEILPNIDVLFLDNNERKLLFAKKSIEKIFQEIRPYFQGIFLTGDTKYMHFFDSKHLYRVKIEKSRVTDLTGAGDALGSGLVSGLMQGMNIIKAIQLAYANADSCIKQWGAKEGLLKKGDRYKKIKVEKIL